MSIDQGHVQEWMRSREATPVDVAVSIRFGQHLERASWLHSRIDWSGIEHVDLLMDDEWEARVGETAAATKLRRHSHLLFMFGPARPSMLTVKEGGLRDVDLIYSASAGARYFCGANISVGTVRPSFDDFADSTVSQDCGSRAGGAGR